MTVPYRTLTSRRSLALASALLLFSCFILPPAQAGEEKEKTGPVRVHIAGIRMVGPDQTLLVLADEKEKRAVPISVGRGQGVAIVLGREKTPTPRPMTHDLMVLMLKTLGAAVERVTVTELKGDTYYAEIAVRAGDRGHRIDPRPSDAIALAVRLDTPIFASPELLRLQLGSDEPGVVAALGPGAAISP